MSDAAIAMLVGTAIGVVGLVFLGIAWHLCNGALRYLGAARQHLDDARALVNQDPREPRH